MWIASPFTNLNFCELQVWGANLCPPRTSSFASVVSGTYCVNATWGQVCQQTCNNGFIAVAGSSVATCNGASWSAPPLLCAPVCASPPAPAVLGSCSQSLFVESFANATSAAQRFQPINPVQAIRTSWIIVDGSIQAAGSFGCTSGLQLLAQSSAVANYIGSFTLQVSFSTADTAGLMYMSSADGSSYYAVTVNVATDLHTFTLLNAGVSTTLAMTSLPTIANAWYVLTVAYSSGGAVVVTLNSTRLFSLTDASLLTGSMGIIANTAASFTGLSFSTPCYGTCSPTLAQGVCQFTCPTGYIQQGTGRQVCTSSASGASVSWVGSSVNCTLPPPTFLGAYIVTPESQPVNAAVGAALVATAASPTSQVGGGRGWRVYLK